MTDEQKTEQPTQKKLDDSRKKGQIASSREVTNVVMMMAYTLILFWSMPDLLSHLTIKLKSLIELSHQFSSRDVVKISSDILRSILTVFAVPILVILLMALIGNIGQNGFIFTSDPIIPKLNKLSPFKGLKRLFSTKSIVDLTIHIFKLGLISTLLFILIKTDIGIIKTTYQMSFVEVLQIVHWIIIKLMLGVIISMSFLAILDLLYRKYDHVKGLRMSKQEIKDETKQTEGNTEVKAKLRKMRTEITNLNINEAIKTADVVITNPEHIAIALEYDMEKMPAPKVIAKGKDHMALKIKDLAKSLKIIIVENKPLARVLFPTVEVGDFIPEKHYKAVAEVINYVYTVRNRPIF